MRLLLHPLSLVRMLAVVAALPAAASAQWVVSDPTNLAAALSASAKADINAGLQIAQQIQQTTQLVSQVKTMIADHVPLSQILQGQGGSLLSQIAKNNSIISTDMSTNGSVLADFQKVSPGYDGTQSFLNYFATIRRNANSQYASSLSMTQGQLQQEGGVSGAVQNMAGVRATNQLQALQQIVGIGQIQTTQMDSLIKIQAAMLKSMSTYYAAQSSSGSGTLPSTQTEAVRNYCIMTVPGFAHLTGSNRTTALASCQQQMQTAAQTQSGGGGL